MSINQLGSQVICQVGLVVDDIDAASEAWAKLLGVPKPTPMVTGELAETQMRYRGVPSEAKAKLAFLNAGQVQIELIQPIGDPSIWKEYLDKHGNGVQHLAFTVAGMQQNLEFLETMGIGLSQKGEFTGGRYAYVDAAAKLGVDLELLEIDR